MPPISTVTSVSKKACKKRGMEKENVNVRLESVERVVTAGEATDGVF